MDMAKKPNIIYVLADDMGYGDVSCLNPQGKLHTPHLDRLAAEGMAFTDAHASSAVCTPSRYSILTGRYNWRSALKRGVLGEFCEPMIEPGRLTVAEMLRQQGYRTHCIGKWHLGISFAQREGEAGHGYEHPEGCLAVTPGADHPDYTKPLVSGPLDCGFDHFFGVNASLDVPPYAYIEDDHFTKTPSGWSEREQTSGRGDWWRGGPIAPDFKHVDVLETLTDRVVEIVAAQPEDPYFVYFPLTAPHTPILPSKEYEGKSGMGPYGDFVLMCDGMVGKILDKLDETGQAENTIVVFAADNGCSPQANFPRLLANGHNPSYVFRGMKSDIYEGGHRIPLLVRWPAGIQAGGTSAQMVCLSDLMATLADLLGTALPEGAAEDSVSNLPLWQGREEPVRDALVHHSINGSFSIRSGNWKLELCPGSGGWSYPKANETAGLPPIQLYRLDGDVHEDHNLQAQCPDVAEQLLKRLVQTIQNGRSTPGTPQKNTGPERWQQVEEILQLEQGGIRHGI